jgi:hypothetical protein
MHDEGNTMLSVNVLEELQENVTLLPITVEPIP